VTATSRAVYVLNIAGDVRRIQFG
ncbi:MAG: hypothetical protein RI939_115, partial [Actinomycetota bacterium]